MFSQKADLSRYICFHLVLLEKAWTFRDGCDAASPSVLDTRYKHCIAVHSSSTPLFDLACVLSGARAKGLNLLLPPHSQTWISPVLYQKYSTEEHLNYFPSLFHLFVNCLIQLSTMLKLTNHQVCNSVWWQHTTLSCENILIDFCYSKAPKEGSLRLDDISVFNLSHVCS